MEPAKDLFELSVNGSGKEWIRRFAKIVKWVFLFGILITLIELVTIFIRLLYLHPLLKENVLLELANLAHSYWLIGYLVILLIQIFLLKRSAKAFSIAINANNEETLSKAFRALYYYTLFGLIALIGSVIMAAFDVFVSFRYYRLF